MTAASTPDLQPCGGRQIMFGSFRLYPDQRVLLRAETPVRLGGRALEILIALVEHTGKIVRKADLTARVWPDTFVEAGTLRVHIVKLRNVLGEGQHCVHYVESVFGRGYPSWGYRFVAPVTRTGGSLPEALCLAQRNICTICP